MITAPISIGLPRLSLTFSAGESRLHARRDAALDGKRVGPAQSLGAVGAAVVAEQRDDGGLGGLQRNRPTATRTAAMMHSTPTSMCPSKALLEIIEGT
jgi:hypothetical protein